MKRKSNPAILNTTFSLISTLVTMMSGFIVPRITLVTFGSEVNGLVASLQQYLNYIVLLEGGLGGVVMASLYKPILEHNVEKISKIVRTVEVFYRRIAIVFVVYAVALSFVYPRIVETTLTSKYVFWLAIILAISSFVQYFFSITNRILLNASKKVYITAGILIACTVLNVLLFIICVRVFPSIHAVKLVTAVVYLLQPIGYKFFVDKYFNLIKVDKGDNDLIKDRWAGFGINIAAFIHSNTDVVIITLLLGLKSVSVYAVYYMIISAIRTIIMSFSSGLQPSVGELVARNNKEYLLTRYNAYETSIGLIAFILFSCCSVLIVPFVKIYTAGVTDVSYVEPWFALMLCLAEMIYCVRDPSSIIIYSANMFREISKYAYIEAILNVGISLVLVVRFGLIGVAIGTLVSIGMRYCAQMVFLSKNIIFRKPIRGFKSIIVFGLGFMAVILVSRLYIDRITLSYFSWAAWAIVTVIVAAIIFLVLMLLFFKEELKQILYFIVKRKKTG